MPQKHLRQHRLRIDRRYRLVPGDHDPGSKYAVDQRQSSAFDMRTTKTLSQDWAQSESTIKIEVLMSSAHPRRATAWLCLAVALLITLMPAAGVMVCLGHNGHVGFGAVIETGACPCEHDSAIEGERSADSSKNEDRHPPCSDIALDHPVALKDAECAQKLPKPADVRPDDNSPAVASWTHDGSREDYGGVASPPRVACEAARAQEQLAHQRSIVLLI